VNISYLVTCKNESDELRRLTTQLSRHISENKLGDEIVILNDFTDNPDTIQILKEFENIEYVKIVKHSLNGNFGEHKTYGSRCCAKDVIIQLDADEYLATPFLENMHELLECNPTVELYRVPRVNIVRGATAADAMQWGWRFFNIPQHPNLPIINWPDYQSRIYKNSEKIFWKKKLHETITGAEIVTEIPLDPDFAIIHDKTIDRQRKQNEFYNKNWSIQENQGLG
jgi:glycosyltransferase involved in cell wall biosynthesis